MKLILVVTGSALATMSAFAQGQIRNTSTKVTIPTKAELQTIVQSIIGNKPKVQAYCQLSKLYDQLTDATVMKDKQSLHTLQTNAEALSKTLGPDYQTLLDAHDQVDPDSSDGRQISAAFDKLDKQCK